MYIGQITTTTRHIFNVKSVGLEKITLEHHVTRSVFVVNYQQDLFLRQGNNQIVPCLGELPESELEKILK